MQAAFERLFSIEFLRRREGPANVEGGQLQRSAGIAKNQSDEPVDDKDQPEGKTEIEHRGYEQK
ncbi:hypothetical protein [Rhizobium phaseoli]|uniref:hypothetical protein n=1 Tax=Rhizobium phaseoli TaxID=396 RepID=UPI001484F60F|nr:hypothetical protein [Rhizobium phaseoli]